MVYCDRQSVIDLRKNSTYHSRAMYIDVWICQALKKKIIKVQNLVKELRGDDMETLRFIILTHSSKVINISNSIGKIRNKKKIAYLIITMDRMINS